ncbi:MAG TPA: hypothetical protein VLQ90_06495 [Pyrinomonadaceae bacterium]|nr:hypothetical protein [Pyrinomonadaceae bacterium]
MNQKCERERLYQVQDERNRGHQRDARMALPANDRENNPAEKHEQQDGPSQQKVPKERN